MSHVEFAQRASHPRIAGTLSPVIAMGNNDAAIEEAVRCALAAGDPQRALSNTIAAYGAEVYGFLRAVMPHGQDARLTYGQSIEVLLHELVDFDWQTELRVLLYAVARRQARRDRESRGDASNAGQHLPPEDVELLVLRLDRDLSWRQIAYTSLEAPITEDALNVEEVRQRARFVAVRRELSQPGEGG